MKKKIITAALVLSMALAATGCGSKDKPAETPTVTASSNPSTTTSSTPIESSSPSEAATSAPDASSLDASSVLEQAQKNMENAKSLEAKSTMKTVMEGEENGEKQSLEMNTTTNVALFTDPYKAKVDVTVDLGEAGGKQEISMYLMKQKKKYYTYTNAAGQWTKQKMPKALFEQTIGGYNSDAYLQAYKECIDNFTVTTAEENGSQQIILEGNITGDAMQKMVEASGALNQTQASTDTSAILSNLSGIPVKMTVDQATMNIQKMSMDMKELMATIMSSNADTQGISVTEATMDMEYLNIDNATDFELPAEAKDAKEAAAQ